jgi:hypothetical protein
MVWGRRSEEEVCLSELSRHFCLHFNFVLMSPGSACGRCTTRHSSFNICYPLHRTIIQSGATSIVQKHLTQSSID